MAAPAARDFAGYVGVGFVALRLVGGAAASAALVLYAVVVAVLGSPTDGLWSWPLYDSRSVSAAIYALTLLVAGMVAASSQQAFRALARADP